ncbi:MAG: hypothetical protein DYG89_29020 [Caldilinea sp. CFX5]|nr:hypothetical protein [Caldilinea sp. CFX5]
MRLNQDQQTRLLDELKDVFTVLADVQMLIETADPPNRVSLDQVAMGPDLVEILRRIIRKADDENWLGNLLAAAIEMRPVAPGLILLHTEFDDIITAERADHFATCWLLGDRVLVDREPLRDAVKQLDAVPGSEAISKRVMVVTGPRKSGRSWSLQYIRYLNETRRNFRLVWPDLEELKLINDDEGFGPEDLGRSIAEQMGLDMADWPTREKEKDEKWVWRFCDWLTRKLTGTQVVYWIVLDSFDKILLPDGIYLLIKALAKRIQANLDMLRLVLLSYNREDDLPADVIPDVKIVPTSPLGDQELLAFFARLYDQRKRRFGIDFTPTDVANSVAEVRRQVADFGTEGYMFKLGPVIVKEAKKLRNAGGGT